MQGLCFTQLITTTNQRLLLYEYLILQFSATYQATSLVADILSECASARTAGNALQEQLVEISRQLTVARQQCSMKDRALCYTLQHAGFDVAFSTDNVSKKKLLIKNFFFWQTKTDDYCSDIKITFIVVKTVVINLKKYVWCTSGNNLLTTYLL